MTTADYLDTVRSVVLLIAALIGLLAAILSIIHSRAKEADTPEARQTVYRSALGWIEAGLWIVASFAAFLPFGATWAFFAILPAFALEVYLFLTSNDPGRLRFEIFRLIFTAQAATLMGVMAGAQRLLALLEKLLDTLLGK